MDQKSEATWQPHATMVATLGRFSVSLEMSMEIHPILRPEWEEPVVYVSMYETMICMIGYV